MKLATAHACCHAAYALFTCALSRRGLIIPTLTFADGNHRNIMISDVGSEGRGIPATRSTAPAMIVMALFNHYRLPARVLRPISTPTASYIASSEDGWVSMLSRAQGQAMTPLSSTRATGSIRIRRVTSSSRWTVDSARSSPAPLRWLVKPHMEPA